jgi:uncharacterized membrane protein YccC
MIGNRGRYRFVFRNQDIADALRNTLTVIFPLGLFFYLGYPSLAVGIGTGTLLICMTDISGSRFEKLFGAWSSIAIFALVSTLTAFYVDSVILPVVVCLLTFMLIMLGSLGQRLAVIGIMGMVLATFTIGLHPKEPLQYGLFITIGGIWYFLVSLLQVWLFPYHPLRRALAKTRQHTAAFLELRARGYDTNASLSGFNSKNISLHLKLTANHETIRRLLLGDSHKSKANNANTKKFLHQSLTLIDLFEQVSAVHYDYPTLRKSFAGSGALELIRDSILLLVDKLNFQPIDKEKIDQHIFELQSITERSDMLARIIANLKATAQLVFELDEVPTLAIADVKHYGSFLSDKRVSIDRLRANLNFSSPVFRFALRMAGLMLVTVFAIGYLPKESYGYWLPLTLIIVCRPSYGVTLKRNIERISGTLLGLCMGWLLIALQPSNLLLLSLAIVSLFIFFVFLSIRYWVSAIGITLAVVLCLSIYHGHSEQILSDRLLFTLLGCMIGLGATFLFPVRHAQQLKNALKNTLYASKTYLEAVSAGANEIDIKLARKQSYLTLANLSDGLSQAEKEPKWRREELTALRQIELLCFQLNALVAAIPNRGINRAPQKENYLPVFDELAYCIKAVEATDTKAVFKLKAITGAPEQALELISISKRLKSYFVYLK